MNNDKNIRIFFVHKPSTEKYTPLKSLEVQTQVPDLELLEFVEDNAPGWIQERLEGLRWPAEPELKFYLWPEPPTDKAMPWKEEHVATAANEGNLSKFILLEDDIGVLEGRTSWDFIIVFETSQCDLMVFERTSNSYTHIKSLKVQTQVPDLELLEFVEDNAPGWIQGRLKELRRPAWPEFEYYLWPEPPTNKPAAWKEECVATAANDGKLIPLEDDIDVLEGRTSRDFIVVFETSRYDFMVFERMQNSYESLGSHSVVAFPRDIIRVIYDAAHSYIAEELARRDTSVTATIEVSRLSEVKDDENMKKYNEAQTTGHLDPDLSMRQLTAHWETGSLRDIKTANLLFVFTAKRVPVCHKLTIDCVLFRRDSGSYHCETNTQITMFSTEIVGNLIEVLRGYIGDCGYKGRHKILVYEPIGAFQSAYKKTPDEIKDLKLEGKLFSDDNCILHPTQGPMSRYTQGQTLIIVFEISAQPQPALPTETSLVRKFKDMKLTNTAPSAIGRFEVYKKMQESIGERIWDDRPEKDKHIAPIALIYQPFGYFHDIRCGIKVPEEHPSSEGAIWEQVDLLAGEMARFYDDERERSSKFIQHLEKILFVQGRSVNCSKVLNTMCVTDASYDGDHGAMIFCMECKKELSLASCEPVPQLVAYIAASIKGQMASGGGTAKLFERWRAPALGIMLVGPFIQFLGVIWLGHMRVVALTPLLPLTDQEGEQPRRDLFQAFKAASIVFSRIEADVKDAVKLFQGPDDKLPPLVTDGNCKLPGITEVDVYPPNGSQKCKFVIESRYDSNIEHRLLYRAFLVPPISSEAREEVYVKFSDRYSAELHQFCAERGLAPEIRGFQRLSGGWFAVVMEKIETVDPMDIISPMLVEGWKKDIKDLVDGFNEKGWVHGDLRPANFVFTRTRDPPKMLLVDFDWGGNHDQVEFPDLPLNDELQVKNDQLCHRRITKQHDQGCLERVFTWLDAKCTEAGELQQA